MIMRLALALAYVVASANAVSTPQPSTAVGAGGDPHPLAWLEVRVSLVSTVESVSLYSLLTVPRLVPLLDQRGGGHMLTRVGMARTAQVETILKTYKNLVSLPSPL
jgi:hypothetical protein